MTINIIIKSILGISFVLPWRHKLDSTSWCLIACANYSNMHAIYTSTPYIDIMVMHYYAPKYYLLAEYEFEGGSIVWWGLIPLPPGVRSVRLLHKPRWCPANRESVMLYQHFPHLHINACIHARYMYALSYVHGTCMVQAYVHVCTWYMHVYMYNVRTCKAFPMSILAVVLTLTG